MIFKIFVLVIVFGKPDIMSSNAMYSTMEECEKMRLADDTVSGSVAKFTKDMAEQYGKDVEVLGSKCEQSNDGRAA